MDSFNLSAGLFYSMIADSDTDWPIMLYHLSKYCGVTSHSSFTTTILYAYDNHTEHIYCVISENCHCVNTQDLTYYHIFREFFLLYFSVIYSPYILKTTMKSKIIKQLNLKLSNFITDFQTTTAKILLWYRIQEVILE